MSVADGEVQAEPPEEHPIFGPLTDEQLALLRILVDQWRAIGEWPVLDYVRRVLSAEQGADLFDIVSRMPVAQSNPQNRYGLTFFEQGPFQQPSQRMGLTIGGLHRIAAVEAGALARVVGFLADKDAGLRPDPREPVTLEVPVVDLMTTHLRRDLQGWRPQVLADALSREPALYGVIIGQGEDAVVRPSSDRIAPFRGVTTAEAYLGRLVLWFGARAAPPSLPVDGSPLSLAEALGYLDAIWRLRFGDPLLGRPAPTSYARLVMEARSTDEFDARLSALADILSHMEIILPDAAEAEATAGREGSLRRLDRRLALQLSGSSAIRVHGAVARLRAIVKIRAAGQHSGMGSEMAAAFQAIGVPYPPVDYAIAWIQIRAVATESVNIIREELQAV